MNLLLILLLKDVNKSFNGGREELVGDVSISYWVFGIADMVELTHNFRSLSFIPGMANGKLRER